MWELDYKESWVPKNSTVVLERTLESPLDIKEIKPVHPKGNQSWIFIGRTDAEAENSNTLATWCEHCLIWKDPDAGKDWEQEEKGTTEDEMVRYATLSKFSHLCEPPFFHLLTKWVQKGWVVIGILFWKNFLKSLISKIAPGDFCERTF